MFLRDAAFDVAAPLSSARESISWWERWLQRRDRLLASRAFQRWAAGFVFTRPIARARARSLFDLVAGFVYSQVLLASVRLGLFELLAQQPLTLPELSSRLGLNAEAARRLLDAAVALKLLERRRHQRYGLGPLGAPLVGNTALQSMIEHHGALYDDLRDPVALLRGSGGAAGLSTYWPYAGDGAPSQLDAASVARYSALMSASQPLVADEILDAYAVASHRCLMDVGGGEGTFLAAAAQRAPSLQLMLFDLPAVADRARERFAALALTPRARAVGGDFLSQPLPVGADLITLVRVIHDHSDEGAMTLLRSACQSLPPGGTLLLAEPMARSAGDETMGDAYFGFYLWAMGRGRARSSGELTQMLKAAGFAQVRRLRTNMPLQTGLLMARTARA